MYKYIFESEPERNWCQWVGVALRHVVLLRGESPLFCYGEGCTSFPRSDVTCAVRKRKKVVGFCLLAVLIFKAKVTFCFCLPCGNQEVVFSGPISDT